MNIFKKLASFIILTALVALCLMCNYAPSHAETNDAISYDAATKTVTIQGNCDTDEIYNALHNDGIAAQAKTLHFAGTSTITTKQTTDGPFEEIDSLKYITADENAHVSFAGNGSAAPTLYRVFVDCFNLISIDGLSSWDVSNISGDECMMWAFASCTRLTSLSGLSTWDLSSVHGRRCMDEIFNDCRSLTSLDDLSAWNVSGVSGDYCMEGMFAECTSLTSLDGLSAWDVSGVSGQGCMEYMFRDCSNVASIDALASWNIQAALQSHFGVMLMFGADSEYGRGDTFISSLTVSSTFTLSNDMFRHIHDALPAINWWPVDAANPSVVDMEHFVAATQDTATNGYRWIRCTDGTCENPKQTLANLSVPGLQEQRLYVRAHFKPLDLLFSEAHQLL